MYFFNFKKKNGFKVCLFVFATIVIAKSQCRTHLRANTSTFWTVSYWLHDCALLLGSVPVQKLSPFMARLCPGHTSRFLCHLALGHHHGLAPLESQAFRCWRHILRSNPSICNRFGRLKRTFVSPKCTGCISAETKPPLQKPRAQATSTPWLYHQPENISTAPQPTL